MTDFGCACCRRRLDCEVDPSICQDYEHDEKEAVKLLVGKAVAETSSTFKRVVTWPQDGGGVSIRVSVATMPEAPEKRRLLRAIAARLTDLNAEHQVLKDGSPLTVTFEELSW